MNAKITVFYRNCVDNYTLPSSEVAEFISQLQQEAGNEISEIRIELGL